MISKSKHGFVEKTKRGFSIDKRLKIGSVLTNGMILELLIEFLDDNYGDNRSGLLLDAGAGSKPYEVVYSNYFQHSVSFDIPSSLHNVTDLDVMTHSQFLPFKNETFDCIL